MSFEIVRGRAIDKKLLEKYKDMLKRCSPAYQSINPTYEGVYICEEWKDIHNFCDWAESQIWDGLELDKDILKVGNKEYGPDWCAFVPKEVNGLVRLSLNSKGTLPIGVYLKTDRSAKPYAAQCRSHDESAKRFLGYYNNPLDAHRAWQFAKVDSLRFGANQLLKTYPHLVNVHDAIEELAYQIEDQIRRGVETVKWEAKGSDE